MRARLLLLTAALLGLGACSSSPPPSGSRATVPPVSPSSAAPAPAASTGTPTPFAPPTGSPAPGGQEVKVDGRTIGGVAPGLGLPPGSRVTDSIVTGESTTVILAAPKPAAVLAHYRAKGPAAGYRLGSDTGGTLALSGKGWQITVTTQTRDSTLVFNPIAAGDPADAVTPGI